MTAHFKTDGTALATFNRLVAQNVAAAVRSVIHMRFSVRREDIDTKHLQELEQMPREMRAEYKLRFATQLTQEADALRLIENQQNIHKGLALAAEDRRREERAAFVEERAGEIERAHFAELRAGFRAQAEREAAERFDGAAPSTQPEPPARKPRRVA